MISSVLNPFLLASHAAAAASAGMPLGAGSVRGDDPLSTETSRFASSSPVSALESPVAVPVSHAAVSPLDPRPSELASWSRRLWSGIAGVVLGGLICGGCTFTVPGLDPVDADVAGDASPKADGADEDMTMAAQDLASPSDSAVGADLLTPPDLKLADPPSPSLPATGQRLGATRAYLYWRNGPIPQGRTVAGYEVCSTTAGMPAIAGAGQCPNPMNAVRSRSVLDPLASAANYHWKVRTDFDDGSVSEWSGVQDFSTDGSLTGWWLLNGNGTDASGLGHNATAQNGAGYAGGRNGQALSLDGINDQMTVANTPDHDFGTGNFTLQAWVNPSRDGMAEAILTKRDMVGGYELYRTAGGQLAFFGVNSGNVVTAGNLPRGAWQHVAATRTAGNVRLYVNGVSVGAAACAENFTNGGGLTFGRNGLVEAFQGSIDEVAARSVDADAGAVVNDFCAADTVAGIDPLPAVCTP